MLCDRCVVRWPAVDVEEEDVRGSAEDGGIQHHAPEYTVTGNCSDSMASAWQHPNCNATKNTKFSELCPHETSPKWRNIKSYSDQVSISLKLLRGTLAPKLVYGVQRKMLLNFSETSARIQTHSIVSLKLFYEVNWLLNWYTLYWKSIVLLPHPSNHKAYRWCVCLCMVTTSNQCKTTVYLKHHEEREWLNERCFRPWFCSVRLYCTGDNLG